MEFKKKLNGWKPSFYRSWSRSRWKKNSEPVKNGPPPQHCLLVTTTGTTSKVCGKNISWMINKNVQYTGTFTKGDALKFFKYKQYNKCGTVCEGLKSFIILAVFRSCHCFGRLRLRKSKVSKPPPVPIKLGRLSLQAKKAAPPRPPYPKICH